MALEMERRIAMQLNSDKCRECGELVGVVDENTQWRLADGGMFCCYRCVLAYVRKWEFWADVGASITHRLKEAD